MADLSSIVKGEYIEGDEKYHFDSLPLWKLIFLSIVTLGIYVVVWFFNIWKRLRVNFGYEINSFFRALFAPITAFQLFGILNDYVKSFNIESFNAVLFAVIYFLINSLWKLPDPLWILCLLTFVIPAIIQNKLNKINEQNFPNAKVNRWNIANTLWAIPCTIVFLLSLVGIFLPD